MQINFKERNRPISLYVTFHINSFGNGGQAYETYLLEKLAEPDRGILVRGHRLLPQSVRMHGGLFSRWDSLGHCRGTGTNPELPGRRLHRPRHVSYLPPTAQVLLRQWQVARCGRKSKRQSGKNQGLAPCGSPTALRLRRPVFSFYTSFYRLPKSGSM